MAHFHKLMDRKQKGIVGADPACYKLQEYSPFSWFDWSVSPIFTDARAGEPQSEAGRAVARPHAHVCPRHLNVEGTHVQTFEVSVIFKVRMCDILRD